MNPQPNPQAAQNYLRTRVLTATPEQLQIMLFDGAMRFCEQARGALQKRDFEASYINISRAQKIILELSGSLKHDLAPDLCGKLASIYNYVYRNLVNASMRHESDALDEAMRMLRYQRETWALLMDQLGKTRAGSAAAKLNVPAPSAAMESGISQLKLTA